MVGRAFWSVVFSQHHVSNKPMYKGRKHRKNKNCPSDMFVIELKGGSSRDSAAEMVGILYDKLEEWGFETLRDFMQVCSKTIVWVPLNDHDVLKAAYNTPEFQRSRKQFQLLCPRRDMPKLIFDLEVF